MKALLVACCLFLISCKEPSVIGNWQLSRIEISTDDLRYTKDVHRILDFTNKESLQKSLYHQALTLRYNETMKDTAGVLRQIDSIIQQSVNLGLVLSSDSTFKMIHGQVFEPPVPGWHIPKDLNGSWQQKSDTLFFNADVQNTDYATGNLNLTFAYKIVEFDAESLALQELGILGAIKRVSGFDVSAYQPSTIIRFQRR
jgi:hypothetical protein